MSSSKPKYNVFQRLIRYIRQTEKYEKLQTEHQNLLLRFNSSQRQVEELTEEIDRTTIILQKLQLWLVEYRKMQHPLSQRDCYVLSVTFDPDEFGGLSYIHEYQKWIAQKVARQIEHEIVSSKFIHKAKVRE